MKVYSACVQNRKFNNDDVMTQVNLEAQVSNVSKLQLQDGDNCSYKIVITAIAVKQIVQTLMHLSRLESVQARIRDLEQLLSS